MNIAAVRVLPVFFLMMITLGHSENPDWCKELPRPEYKTLTRVEASDPWFEVYRIRPGVFAIYEPHQFQEVISYLITGRKSALLFDTGMGISHIRKVVEHLTNLPVAVLNSHTHPDHIGGNYEFRTILGEKIDYTQKNTAGYSSAVVGDWVIGENICGTLPTHFDAHHYSIRPFAISEFVHDEQIIELGDRHLQILFTPGHTPDSICLFDQTNRLLFTGDTFYPGPIYLFAPETDLKAYEKSVSRLAALRSKVDLLLPAHNVPVASPEKLIELQSALKEIEKGTAHYKMEENVREYEFNGFSILLRANSAAWR